MKVILASHGNLASGMLSSADIILGPEIKEKCVCLCAYTTDDYNLELEVKNVLRKYENEENLIIVTDVFGGSVNNEFLKHINRYTFSLITGMNLPMILELLPQSELLDQKQIDQLILNSKQFIIDCNLIIKKEDEEDEF